MVLHLRRGDRLNLHLATDAFEASFGMSRAMFAAMIHAAKQAQPLPMLILSNNTTHTRQFADALMSKDIRVIDRAPCASLDEWAAPPSLQSHHEPSVQKSTLDAIRDWFLIWNAVGVVVDVGTPWGKWGAEESIWAESSFSTTAALTGGVPILTLRTGHRCSGQRKRRFSGACATLTELPEVPDTFALGQAASFASTVRNLATTKGWRKRKGDLDDDSPLTGPGPGRDTVQTVTSS